ncbi:TIGR04282 family arsenosugar biosynthesis glycosyltransferase [Litoreibacter roseus]|uniref:Glycosyltransferase n=1 Tax=Litoreibacter roseus TaxID=2601869 RepID=A0A6N6JH83_9RHOB|nr:TIGR04282 family arsenosugar biosynthesis glycosyltransferase [Litoreibacter roseus]GFE64749.1 hypothetical protein KIN_18230 [Litoreibacter roseus]
MRPTLVVMLKEPRPGRVKTRLGRDIGMVGAAWWFRHQTARLLRRLRDPRWDLVLAVAPDAEGRASRVWPRDLPRWPQGQGDLGQRMARVFRDLSTGPICIVGSDIPDIKPHHINAAFKALGASDAVIGPAPDGGYWLIGFAVGRPLRAAVFDAVRWSSEHALADTVQALSGRRVAFIDPLHDVDTVDDLQPRAC